MFNVCSLVLEMFLFRGYSEEMCYLEFYEVNIDF